MSFAAIRWDMILGGFGLFMFGIQFMGNGLKSVAGDQMRHYIDRYTTKPLSAMWIGILLTILMQSSSASTAIVIGFVRAGLMNLHQAAGLVMGANIGTTFTAFLISLNIDRYSLYIVFLGCMLICFAKRRRFQYIGDVVLGFGLIFFGLSAMGDTLAGLKELPEFENFALRMSGNSWLSMVTGALMTMIVQSSAATIGVIQKLYNANAITLTAALPFMFGANIGTTITGILAAMGGSLGARRTAGLHTIFNIFATGIGMLVLIPYTSFVIFIQEALHLSPMMEIAVSNIIFKIGATIIFFPFLKQMVELICKIVPGKEPDRPQVDINNLDVAVGYLLPAAAIGEAEKAMDQMIKIVRHEIRETQEFLNKPGTADDKQMIDQDESLINNCDKKITQFLINVSVRASIPPNDKERMRVDLDVIKNLERLGDLGINLAEFYMLVTEDDGFFTPDAIEDINTMYDIFFNMYDLAIEIYRQQDRTFLYALNQFEDSMDAMAVKARTGHFARMQHNECQSPVAGSVYCDILGTLERMGDHCCNIAKITLSAMPQETLLKH